MSRLDELIQALCPDGVEYYSIEDCVEKTTNIKWKNTDEQYQYIDLASVDIDTHQITNTLTIDATTAPSRAQQIIHSGDILLGATRPMLKRYCMIDERYDGQICSTGFCLLRPKSNIILNRWLYHNISSNDFFNHVETYQKGASYPSISDADVKRFRIPIPPLEIQTEIVNILDHFTSLTTELTTELTRRRRQYEYYRTQLLTFDESTPKEKLGVTCTMKAGKGIPSTSIFQNESEDTPIKCYGGNGVRGFVKEYNEVGEYPIIGRQGALCGNVNFAEGKFYATEHAVVVKSKGQYNSRFLYHLLTEMNLNQYKSKGAQPGLAVKNIEELTAPIPPLEEQNRIVEILDRFDKLCNNISEGLPAEIEARRKQYEYYRDRLLTFKPKEA